MRITHGLRTGKQLTLFAVVGVAVLLVAACQPIVDPALLEAVQAPAVPTPAEPVEEPSPGETPDVTEDVIGVEPAQATVNTRSLRVREVPDENSEMIAGIKQGETYSVLGISSDGAWIQLEIPQIDAGVGWVSSGFVTLEGDITNIETVDVPTTGGAPEEVAQSGDGDTAEETANDSESNDTSVAEVETAVDPPAAGFALINTGDTPLRVRSAPTTEEDNKIGNVFQGETYRVLEVSDDGQWVRIDVPELNAEEGGWVAAEFVVIGE